MNLSVMTNDGHVYFLLFSYVARPDSLVSARPVFTHANIETYAQGIANNKGIVKGKVDNEGKVEVSLTGFYVKDNVLYLQILLCNHSRINFDIDVLRFFIRDKKNIKNK